MTTPSNVTKGRKLSRRECLKAVAIAAGWSIVPRTAISGALAPPPSERLRIAGVGLGARGLGNMNKCDGADIAALCDVDWRLAKTALDAYPQAAKYKDFRRMLDAEPGIDAVVVSTPDHTHGVIAADAMRRGKHVYVETPMAHDVCEVRQMARLAKETGAITQMGNERHSGPGIRRAVEMVWGGGLGPIREVHCWTNRPQWPQGLARPAGKATPDGLAWDLWLGPAPACNYDPAYHPYRWRGWLDFGTGALGAMGCHLLDVAFWALRLDRAKTFTIEAESTGRGEASFPTASTIRYRFPARGDEPPVDVLWYDGGRLPPRPADLPYGRELGSNGTLFVGQEHSMVFGPTVFGTNPGQVGPRTIPEFASVEAKRAVERIPGVSAGDWVKGNRHIQEWIAACKTGKQPCAAFEYSAGLTEMVLLGNVALQCAGPIEWDVEAMRAKNRPDAERLIRRAYRAGWKL